MNVTLTSIAPVFPVDDVEASVRWYVTMLGFGAVFENRDPNDEDPTNYAVLRRDQVALHLIRRAEAAERFAGAVDAQFSIAGDIDAFFEALRARGVNVLQSPQDQPWGCRDFIVTDPSGNKVWISRPQSLGGDG